MKTIGFALLVAIALAVAGPDAIGVSIPPDELIPGETKNGTTLEMSSEQLPNGDTKFIVKIIDEKRSLLGYRFCLSDLNFKDHENGFGFSFHPVRTLAAMQEGNVITCAFSVTKKELDTPNLSFSFYRPPPSGALAVPYVRFTRLAKTPVP